MYTYMKMKRKQDPPTSPFYTTPRVYLYMLTSSEQEFFEDFVPATCPTRIELCVTCRGENLCKGNTAPCVNV